MEKLNDLFLLMGFSLDYQPRRIESYKEIEGYVYWNDGNDFYEVSINQPVTEIDDGLDRWFKVTPILIINKFNQTMLFVKKLKKYKEN